MWERTVRGMVERESRVAQRSGGGTALLVAGLGLWGLSLYMLFDNVQISGGLYWGWGFGWSGRRSFGWTLLPLLIGIGWVVWRPRGLGGWALTALGVALVALEVLSSLHFTFRPVSLITLLIMLVPGAVGLALVAKHL